MAAVGFCRTLQQRMDEVSDWSPFFSAGAVQDLLRTGGSGFRRPWILGNLDPASYSPPGSQASYVNS